MSENLPPNERPARSRTISATPALWVGVVLVLLGLFFLLENLGVPLPNWPIFRLHANWWALFLLIPAGLILSRVYQAYQEQGQLTRHMRNQLLIGVLILIAAATALFNVNWAVFWPFLLIAGGLYLLLRDREAA